MPFDLQAYEMGYNPCARGWKFCELEAVRPGRVQCPCDDPCSLANELREIAEELHDEAQADDDLEFDRG